MSEVLLVGLDPATREEVFRRFLALVEEEVLYGTGGKSGEAPRGLLLGEQRAPTGPPFASRPCRAQRRRSR